MKKMNKLDNLNSYDYYLPNELIATAPIIKSYKSENLRYKTKWWKNRAFN